MAFWDRVPIVVHILLCTFDPDRMRAEALERPTAFLVETASLYLVQTGPASLVNVLLSENQPFTAIEGVP